GIEITGSGTNNNWVAGNYIGTNAAGTGALGNGSDGVWIHAGAQFNLIGTNADGVDDAAERNVISVNTLIGLEITANLTNNNSVAGNFIGLNAAGIAALANQGGGVFISRGAQNNTVGGVVAAARNVISGNTLGGIGFGDASTNFNVIEGNYIGLN